MSEATSSMEGKRGTGPDLTSKRPHYLQIQPGLVPFSSIKIKTPSGAKPPQFRGLRVLCRTPPMGPVFRGYVSNQIYF